MRRPFRRLTTSRFLTRGAAHLVVIGIVASATLAGIAQRQADAGVRSTDPGFLPLISSARGAAETADPYRSTSVSLRAQPMDSMGLDRAAPAVVPPLTGAVEPMPTPVPVDPNATPLPAPSGVGQTSTSSRGGGDVAPPAARGALLWPVPAGSISQYYHAGHLALDIAAPYGSTVVAAQAGVVTGAGWRNNGGGIVISIDHGNGMTTVYNHLGGTWVSPGQYVGAGQGIGSVGCTGLCTGPHVHYEVIVNGIIDNPSRYY